MLTENAVLIPEIKDLARKALRLNLSKNFNQVVFEFANIVRELNRIHQHHQHPALEAHRQVWVITHPITRLLAFKIKNMTCMSPDVSYMACEHKVSMLAGVSEEPNETKPKRIQTPVRGKASPRPNRKR